MGGISRDSRHKRRATGGRMPVHQKKRKFESGRPAASTKLAEKRIRVIRSRGGNTKLRALRLNMGNFVWQSEQVSKKSKIVNVVYNPVSNELVRTNTLTKGTICYVDGAPFNKYIQGRYFGNWNSNKDDKPNWDWEVPEGDVKVDKTNKSLEYKCLNRRLTNKIEKGIQEQLTKGSILVRISSRPGQSGRCDGVVLEGKELEFYLRKLPKKKA